MKVTEEKNYGFGLPFWDRRSMILKLKAVRPGWSWQIQLNPDFEILTLALNFLSQIFETKNFSRIFSNDQAQPQVTKVSLVTMDGLENISAARSERDFSRLIVVIAILQLLLIDLRSIPLKKSQKIVESLPFWQKIGSSYYHNNKLDSLI